MQRNRDFPHTALIYKDWRNRNHMIDSCLARANATWRSSVVVSAQPEVDARYFRKRGLSRRSVLDVKEALAGGSPAKHIASLIGKACQDTKKERPGLVLGDWLHQVYDEFETGLEVEEAVKDKVRLVCCYRGEGFWSLDVNHLARIFELHDRIMFGTTVFDRNV